MDWESWTFVLSMAATAAFAVTAVLAIHTDRDIDLFGAVVFGLITAIGGGTIRDVILDVPVFWSEDLSYVWTACIASILAIYLRQLFSAREVYLAMLLLDAFGAAMFGVLATGKVWDLDFGLPAAPVILGVATAIGGGLIRDVLSGGTTLLMQPELYAVPVLIGCVGFVLVLTYLPEHRFVGSIVCVLATFSLRVATIHWGLQMPGWARLVHDEDQAA